MTRLDNKAINIYYPSQYPRKISPAQRYRIEQFEPLLLQENIKVHAFPFISAQVYPIFFKQGFLLKKAWAIFSGFCRRFEQLFSLHKYDMIFINREASPLGPPVFEWLYTKVFKKKIVYDFDDAVWLSATSDANKIAHRVKAFWKIKYIIKWSAVIIGGNDYLCNYAKNYNSNTFLIPTVVDTHLRFNRTVNQEIEPVTIGWTGSFSTMSYLEKLLPVLAAVAQDVNFRFILISNKKPDFDLPNMEYVEWSEKSEIDRLLECQIGLMPMAKDEWALGKCGFKIIQYMALGMVPLADDWGVNAKIIDDGVNGYLVREDSDWEFKIRKVLTDTQSRKKMAHAAQISTTTQYSVNAVFPQLLQIIRAVVKN